MEQYVRFSKIADENRKKYGMTEKAIEETLRQCREEGILMPFLAAHEKEVCDIMVTLFDQEKIWEIHDFNVARDAKREGREEGAEMALLSNLKALMKKLGFTAEEAMDTLGVPAEIRVRLQGQL